jgi:hypothetical protein
MQYLVGVLRDMLVDMNWDTKRKVLYALATTVALLAISIFLLRDTLFPEPTCIDGKQNGFEAGLDCGGVCVLRCEHEVKPLSVLWSKALQSGHQIYDLVALISNPNIDNASQVLGYTFTVYDEEGGLVTTLSGSTTAPLDGKFPVIIQNVSLSKKPSNVVATLNDTSHYKVQENPRSPTVRIIGRRYEGGLIPRVYATIANTKRIEIRNLPVRVLIFDEKDNVYGVGETFIPYLPKEGVHDAVITWNESFPYPPTRIEVYPVFSPFEIRE